MQFRLARPRGSEPELAGWRWSAARRVASTAATAPHAMEGDAHVLPGMQAAAAEIFDDLLSEDEDA